MVYSPRLRTNPDGARRYPLADLARLPKEREMPRATMLIVPSLALGAGCIPFACCAQAQENSAPSASASGNDVVHPIQRIDLRVEVTSKEDTDELATTLRYTRPQPIGGGWTVNLRGDLPFVRNNEVSIDNPDGGYTFGVGDVLLQAVFVRHTSETEGVGIGTQLIAPTASEEGLGKGKWRLRPTIGYRWGLPKVSEKTFFQLLTRYDFSFAGDKDRSNVSELQFAPNLEFGLPGEAYFSIFPSTDIRYNFKHKEFFLPIDLEVGKEWERLVVSLEGAAGVVSDEHAPYKWRLEARIGYRF